VLRWIYIIVAFVILLSLGLNDFLITSNLFVGFPNSVLFFIDFFQIPFGLNSLISAFILRFLIRRVHLIS
jgi:hypothetical protein